MERTFKLIQRFSFFFIVAINLLPVNATIWSTHTMDNAQGNKVCFAASTPKSSKGNYTKRGPVQLMISHRPKDNVHEEISIEMGYPLEKDSEVNLIIDGSKKFCLFINGETAWAYDKKDDEKIIKALKAGKTAVIEGKSSKGTVTTDTFQLAGLTAACNMIHKDCKAKPKSAPVKNKKTAKKNK